MLTNYLRLVSRRGKRAARSDGTNARAERRTDDAIAAARATAPTAEAPTRAALARLLNSEGAPSIWWT